MTPRLAAIHVYPIKSLDGVSVENARVLPSGALEHDRQFALVDAVGNIVNAKRHASMHRLRTRFDLVAKTVTCGPGDSARFHLVVQREELVAWLTEFFGFEIHLRENVVTGFPDDHEALGPTIVSATTLETVTTWFPELTTAETRRRFRANLELADVEPFWEDRLFGEASSPVRFRIGDVEFVGTNPCQRCAVPGRDSRNGESHSGFAAVFSVNRQRALPIWATRSRFDHFYRLAVNTRLSKLGSGTLRVGDELRLA